jgi:hypothetical protein
MPAESRRVLTDASIFGIGFMKHYIGPDEMILNERTFPSEIFVGMWDGRDMRPRSLYQVGFQDRDLLAARFPSMRRQILNAGTMSDAPRWNTSRPDDDNVIPYAEAWHLPSSKAADDGRHVLCLTDDDVLVDEDWTSQSFPFSVLRFCDMPTGYQGIGIAEICQGDQSALNDANLAEYWAWSQLGMPRVAFQTGTVDVNKLNSSLSGILLEIDGPAPQVLNWSATHPDFVAWKKDLKLTAFNRVGISPTTAGGEKPIGLNSGEAQRVYADQKKTRFAVLNQRWQEFQVEACKQNMRLAGRLVEENGNFKVKVLGKDTFEVLDLKDFHLEEDEYRMQILPVSELPKTFAGRLQTVTEMLQARLIDTDTGRRLLELPDLESAEDEVNAAKDHAERIAYQLLHTDDEVHPDIALEGMAGIQLCIATVTAALLRATDCDAPQDKIDRGMTWLSQARAVVKQATMPPPAPPGPPGAGGSGGPPQPPLAKGAAPPVNQMLPFAAPRAA